MKTTNNDLYTNRLYRSFMAPLTPLGYLPATNNLLRAFSSFSLPFGLMNDWVHHVIDLLEYGDLYIDGEHLEKLCTRIYKEGGSVDFNQINNHSQLSGIYEGEDKLEHLMDDPNLDHSRSTSNNSYLKLIKKINTDILIHTPKINKVSKNSNVFIKPYDNVRSFSTSFYASKVTTIDKTFKYDSPLYNKLSVLIEDNPINAETQKKIEESLLDYSYIHLDNESKPFSGIDYSIINSKLSKVLFESKQPLIKLIINFKQDIKTSKRIKPNKTDILNIEVAKILSKVKHEYLVNIIYGRILKIISTYNRSMDNLNSMVDLSYDLGRDLVNKYYHIEYLRAKSKTDEIYYLSNWKRDNTTIVDKFEDSTFIFNLGSLLINFAITCDLLELKIVKLSKIEKVNIILPTEKLIKTISKNIVFNLPKRIPMIVPPKAFTNKNNGGYLLNDELTTDSIIKNKWNNKELSTIKDNNVIYDLVNNIHSVGYKINKDVLDFILYNSDDYFKNEIIDLKYKHPLIEKSKLIKSEKIELDSFLSKKELQENILGLASVLSGLPSFYIPVNLDFRGRLYCVSEFLNYQSTELAKALLLFSKAEKIYKTDNMSINYLKIYGATTFGLDKKSAKDRLDWVDSNTKNIIDFRNGNLIKKAKNKFLFLAFCLEYNRWLLCLENHDITFFETFLPIQLDGTCNGFQHLSLLSLDSELGLELNLNESTCNDKPKDFYSFLVDSLMDYFKTEVENNKNLSIKDKEGYQRLIDFNIKREIIKKSVMTIPYNVSRYQLVQYIKDNFENIDDNTKEWYSSKENPELKLKYYDFTLLGDGLRKILSYKFQKLNLLLVYLEKLATVCTLLEIPILWTLPSGLEVKQSYVQEDEIRIKPFYYTKNRFSLRVLDKSKYNKQKQITAFMPNLVHSLDAASLALLLDSYFKGIREIKNIYTVHDCFAVTANNIDSLVNILKLTYIKIYSEDRYLIKLDKGIRDSIKIVYGENSFNDKTLEINVSTFNEPITFPDVNIVRGKKIDFDFEALKKSKYIIN